MSGNVRRSAAQWKELLVEYDSSSSSQAEFCKQHDVKLSTLTSQLSKRQRRGSFMPVKAGPVYSGEEVSVEFPGGLRLTIRQ